MNSTKFEGLRGMVEFIRGVMERAKMSIEEIRGLKCNKAKIAM